VRKYSATTLLAVTSLFEKQALIIFGQIKYEGDLSNTSFQYYITKLTKTNPTTEQWSSWIDVNRTVLGSLDREYWDGANERYAYCEIWEGNEKNYAWVTISPSPPFPDFDTKSMAILKASPPFPVLWLYRGDTVKQIKDPLPPQLAHDTWLYQALQEIAGQGYSEESFAKFVTDNKKTIDKVRRTFEKPPTYLGGGSDGVAFDTGTRILKIFKDDVSYQAAKAAFDRLHKSPGLAKTEAMIYDVGLLGKEEDFGNIYYYIIEKMQTLDNFPNSEDDIKDILEYVMYEIKSKRASKWKPLKNIFNDPNAGQDKINFVQRQVATAARNMAFELNSSQNFIIRKIEQDVPVKGNWVQIYIEEIIMKYLTGRTDLHMGNLGVTPYGQLRYYDPAFSGHTSEINTGD